MAVDARDLPGAAIRRRAVLGVMGMAAIISSWMAVSALAAKSRAAAALSEVESALSDHRLAADGLAAECGIPPFSAESDLPTFPMKVPQYPSKKEMDCAKRVGVARADLIGDHERLRLAKIGLSEAAARAKSRTITAFVLILVFVLGLALLEGRSLTARRMGR